MDGRLQKGMSTKYEEEFVKCTDSGSFNCEYRYDGHYDGQRDEYER